MTLIDLKDAFYSTSIYPEHKRYLKFVVLSKIYQCIWMLNGYGPAMHIFTKVSKDPFSHLLSKGFVSAVFIDDSYLQGNTYEASLHNIESTIELLQNFGFAIHLKKSILTPTQKITFIGFVIDSVQMTLEITEEKENKIHKLFLAILQKGRITLPTLASVIGNFVASFPVVPLG